MILYSTMNHLEKYYILQMERFQLSLRQQELESQISDIQFHIRQERANIQENINSSSSKHQLYDIEL